MALGHKHLCAPGAVGYGFAGRPPIDRGSNIVRRMEGARRSHRARCSHRARRGDRARLTEGGRWSEGGHARMVARRRRAVAVLATMVVVGAGVLGGGAIGSAPASVARAPDRVVVGPGQTLWDVADRYAAPAVDPRAYVDALVRLNHMRGALQPGARLRLPN
jgi:hypothetical protein